MSPTKCSGVRVRITLTVQVLNTYLCYNQTEAKAERTKERNVKTPTWRRQKIEMMRRRWQPFQPFPLSEHLGVPTAMATACWPRFASQIGYPKKSSLGGGDDSNLLNSPSPQFPTLPFVQDNENWFFFFSKKHCTCFCIFPSPVINLKSWSTYSSHWTNTGKKTRREN